MKLFPDDIFNLADIALDVARTDPERTAVIEQDGYDSRGKRRYKYYTYRELSADAEAVAVGLREMGIAELTRIVFMAPPGYDACVMGLALCRVGAVTVWIDTGVGYLNIAERLRRISIEAFFGIPAAHMGRFIFGWGPRFLRKAIVTGKPGFPGARTVKSLRRPAPAKPAPPAVNPDDPAAILYTTGSTGPAKPALYLHRNFCQLYRNAHYSWRFEPQKEIPVDMAVFPAFLFVPISAGGTMVVPPINFVRQGPADVDPRALIEVINDCGVKSMFGSPVLLENMGRYAQEKGLKTPSLKRIVGAGDMVRAPVKKLLLEMMAPDGEVSSNYGATEAMPSTEMHAEEALRDTWSKTERGAGVCVGRPLPGVELRIISIVDGPVKNMEQARGAAPGEIGEILVRGRHISPFYYRDEESTLKNKIADSSGDSWHRFGDTGYIDREGRLWVCGRAGHRVITAEGPVFPWTCEAIFDTHPKVRRSGLVGVPGKEGQVPVICIELKPGHRSTDKSALCAELLALAAEHDATRCIKHVLFKRSLPVDPRHNSKIERPLLARWAAGKLKNR
jgi:acyl-CoA synthetase (AMP-forming)/AMP-acid ligase II